jgi:hypothetical protein
MNSEIKICIENNQNQNNTLLNGLSRPTLHPTIPIPPKLKIVARYYEIYFILGLSTHVSTIKYY